MIHLLKQIHFDMDDTIQIKINDLTKLFNPVIKQENDCVIMDFFRSKTNGDKKKIVIKDKTGFEASCNEVHLDSILEGNFDYSILLKMAFLLIETWSFRLRDNGYIGKYCFIISCSNNDLVLRFHKVRNNEDRWLSDNIEDYNMEAVGYIDIDIV